MTGSAIFSIFGMLIDKGTLFLGVAIGARLLDRVRFQLFFGNGTMRIVAVGAEYPFFVNGVMTGQIELGLDILMAFKAHHECVTRSYDQVGSFVNIMTIRACNVINIMRSGIPVMEIECCICRMTLKAYQ
jgi:hypothetical protein